MEINELFKAMARYAKNEKKSYRDHKIDPWKPNVLSETDVSEASRYRYNAQLRNSSNYAEQHVWA